VETIMDGVTGIFFDRQEPDDLAAAISHFERIDWSPALLRRHAEGFGTEVFRARLRAFLDKVGAPVPEGDTLPFNARTRSATANLGMASAQEGIPA
jgi:hypothetical protein